MKIKNARPKRKIRNLLLLLLVVGVFSLAYYFYMGGTNNRSTTDVNLDEPTEEQIDAGKNAKLKTVQEDQETKKVKTTDKDSDPDNSSSSFTTQITTKSINSDALQVRNVINGVFSQGACKLVLTKGSNIVTKSADIQALAQSSTCKGFDVPLSQLTSGTWQIDLSVTIDNETAKASTTVEVL